jgi:hypothetical protein
MIGDEARKAMLNITIATYQKGTAMPCMNLLADCRNLQRILIVNGVGTNSNPEKTAKSFFTEAGRLLQNIVNAAGGDKDAALSVVTFGKGCLCVKDKDEDKFVAWDEEDMDLFVDEIAKKLK